MSTYFTEDHEWITVAEDTAVMGITNHAAEQLGEVVYVELREPGAEFEKNDEIGVVESVKAASDIYAPVGGVIVEANQSVVDAPETLGNDPEGACWLYRIRLNNPNDVNELLQRDEYEKLIG